MRIGADRLPFDEGDILVPELLQIGQRHSCGAFVIQHDVRHAFDMLMPRNRRGGHLARWMAYVSAHVLLAVAGARSGH